MISLPLLCFVCCALVHCRRDRLRGEGRSTADAAASRIPPRLSSCIWPLSDAPSTSHVVTALAGCFAPHCVCVRSPVVACPRVCSPTGSPRCWPPSEAIQTSQIVTNTATTALRIAEACARVRALCSHSAVRVVCVRVAAQCRSRSTTAASHTDTSSTRSFRSCSSYETKSTQTRQSSSGGQRCRRAAGERCDGSASDDGCSLCAHCVFRL